MPEKKEKVIFVRTGNTLHAAVKTVADNLDKNVSQFTLDAIKEKIERESKKRPEIASLREAPANV